MYVHRMGHATTTYTHTVANIIPSNDGAHYTHTYKLMLHCMQGVNLFSAHTLASSFIELLVCMFKRTLILFSISVWD